MDKKQAKLKYMSLLLFVLLVAFSYGQNGLVNTDKGIALHGYDAVAYYAQANAIKGNGTYSFTYSGAKWYFVNEANLKAFKSNPSKYMPQYGGWCAYAMGAKGEKVDVDPETFKIIDGKLFLFYNSFLNNTLSTWNKDERNLHIKADANWQLIVNGKH